MGFGISGPGAAEDLQQRVKRVAAPESRPAQCTHMTASSTGLTNPDGTGRLGTARVNTIRTSVATQSARIPAMIRDRWYSTVLVLMPS